MTQVSKKQAFETCTCLLQVRSQNCHTITLNKVTPPEFLLMKQRHGANAVQFKEKTGHRYFVRNDENGKWLRRPMTRDELIERLISKFGTPTFKEVFPGADPVMPYTFEAINVGLEVSGEGNPNDDLDGWEEMPVAQAAMAEAAASGDPVEVLGGTFEVDELDELDTLTSAPALVQAPPKKGK